MESIPLFPLHTVFFPDAVLPLRIFERRYLDMVRDCMRADTGFGVCLIRSGREVGEPAEIFEVGTFGDIVDWEQTPEGLLQITARGTRRFRIQEQRVLRGGLLQGDIEWLEEPTVDVPPRHHDLKTLMSRLIADFFPQYQVSLARLDDAVWLGYRLSECLPLEAQQKQFLLEVEEPARRLDVLNALLQETMEGAADEPS